ncbi:MFS general substrate transporter [Xylariomycetidae sp. FL2044]|nr:MFS general substrate transporter [Xylariomycetidae sp. FL2044]
MPSGNADYAADDDVIDNASSSSAKKGSGNGHSRQSRGRNDDDAASASEDTPLLQQEESSSRRDDDDDDAASMVRSEEEEANGHRGGEDLDTPNQKVTRARGVSIALSLYLLIFLQATNMSGITMAQSTIAEDLDAYENAMWFTTSFLVAASSTAALTGKFATIFAPRTMLLVSSILFGLGCLVTSQAPTLAVFILGRVIAGLGGGGTLILSFILILELTSKRSRGMYIGLLNAGFTSGVSLGAVFFGGLIATTGWRVLFWIQTPVAVLAGLGLFFSVPATLSSSAVQPKGTLKDKLRRIDYLGAVVLTGTIVLFLISLAGKFQWIPLLASLGALVVFLLVETFIAVDPIVPLSVLKSRGALMTCLAQLGFMAARWTVLFYTPITALAVRGFHPATSGSILIPTNLGFGFGGLIVGILHVKRTGSFWSSSIVSFVLFAASLFVLSLCSTPDIPMPWYVIIVFLNGIFTGAALNYTMVHMLFLVAPENHYVASSMLSTFRGFAGSFGSAIGGGIFARTLRGSLERGLKAIDGDGGDQLGGNREELIRRLIGSPALVYNGGLSDDERRVAVDGYVDALRTLFQAAVVLTVVVTAVQAATGWRGPSDKVKAPEEAENGERED